MKRLMAIGILGGLLAGLMSVALRAADTGRKAVGRADLAEALPAAQQAKAGLDPNDSAGIFVGINEFEDKEIPALKYAVDDAVDLAYLFTVERQLLTPKKVWLVLAGKPGKEETRQRLAELKQQGVNLTVPTFVAFLDLMEQVPGKTGEKGMLILQMSSHGYDDNNVGYVMLADSRFAFRNRTAVTVTDIQNALSGAAAPRRLLFIDACRNKAYIPAGGRASVSPSPTGEAFSKAFLGAKGQATLLAAKKDCYSYEDEQLQQGVFTHFLLEGLRGKAPIDEDGIVRMSTLGRWVGDRVQAATKQRTPPQEIKSDIDNDAKDIPLSYVSVQDSKLQQRIEQAKDAINTISRKNRALIPGSMVDQIEAALDQARGENLQGLLGKIEVLSGSKKDALELFASWWKSQGVKLVEPPSDIEKETEKAGEPAAATSAPAPASKPAAKTSVAKGDTAPGPTTSNGGQKEPADGSATDPDVKRGLDYMRDQDFEAAIKAFTAAIRRNPSNALAYAKRADAYGGISEIDKGLEDCTTALRLDANLAEAHLSRAGYLSESGDFTEALAECDTAIQLKPGLARAYALRCSMQSQLSGLSFADAEKTIQLDPQEPLGYVARAICHVMVDHNAIKAKADCQKALSLNPKASQAEATLAIICVGQREVDEALRHAEAALRVAPKYAGFHLLAATICNGKNDSVSALNHANNGLKLAPKNAGLYLQRALANANYRQFQMAIPDLDQAIRLNPKLGDAFLLRGRIHASNNNLMLAIPDLLEVVRLYELNLDKVTDEVKSRVNSMSARSHLLNARQMVNSGNFFAVGQARQEIIYALQALGIPNP